MLRFSNHEKRVRCYSCCICLHRKLASLLTLTCKIHSSIRSSYQRSRDTKLFNLLTRKNFIFQQSNCKKQLWTFLLMLFPFSKSEKARKLANFPRGVFLFLFFPEKQRASSSQRSPLFKGPRLHKPCRISPEPSLRPRPPDRQQQQKKVQKNSTSWRLHGQWFGSE